MARMTAPAMSAASVNSASRAVRRKTVPFSRVTAMAAAALGYCEAFFTESGLAKSIGHRRLGLASKHTCFVTSQVEQAVQHLRSY